MVFGQENPCYLKVRSVGVNPARNSILLIDKNNKVHTFELSTRQLKSTQDLENVFSNAPENIDLIVSNNDQIQLVDERTIHSYHQNPDGTFESVGGTKQLHSRVIFYPDSSISLNNGTVYLINGGVFADYNLASNTPNILGNRDVVLANLPERGFSAFPIDNQPTQANLYVFFDQKVGEYNMEEKVLKNEVNVNQFFSC
ncbi:unnamed protein product [Bursaphelenchus okinawaensis]|uniref:Uncharacterized protein n=1 Tax=Bursaphelenchus okinawaensis TaxID=465554 RepID=A0A811LCM7_9BILA|nr:unnamed protein product [Bursaphelenchus okinawaensis]CAG9121463.1 unnamed protein product [Bursaphelenchus okinawaensis]